MTLNSVFLEENSMQIRSPRISATNSQYRLGQTQTSFAQTCFGFLMDALGFPKQFHLNSRNRRLATQSRYLLS